jgi:hypothetical protein
MQHRISKASLKYSLKPQNCKKYYQLKHLKYKTTTTENAEDFQHDYKTNVIGSWE